MMAAQAMFEALEKCHLEAFVAAFSHAGRTPASRHALRIDSTRRAADRVRTDDAGESGLAAMGFIAGLLLADRLSGPLAAHTRPASVKLATAQAFWCLRGPSEVVLEPLDLMVARGLLPHEIPALSHALFLHVKLGQAMQATEVVDELLARGIHRDRLVGLLARVVTERPAASRALLLLSTCLQLSARLGGDELGDLLCASVRGAIAVRDPRHEALLPRWGTLPDELDEELPWLLARQVGASGVTDLRRVRAEVLEGSEPAWTAVLAALEDKVPWQPLVDILSLVAVERLLRVPARPLEAGGPLAAALEALLQVRAVRWLMINHPSPGAFKAVIQLAAQIGGLEPPAEPEKPLAALTELDGPRLLETLRDALGRGDRETAGAALARCRALNLPANAVTGALIEEAIRGGDGVSGTGLKLMLTESALSEFEALTGSREEWAYLQGLAMTLPMLPADRMLEDALASASGAAGRTSGVMLEESVALMSGPPGRQEP